MVIIIMVIISISWYTTAWLYNIVINCITHTTIFYKFYHDKKSTVVPFTIWYHGTSWYCGTTTYCDIMVYHGAVHTIVFHDDPFIVVYHGQAWYCIYHDTMRYMVLFHHDLLWYNMFYIYHCKSW